MKKLFAISGQRLGVVPVRRWGSGWNARYLGGYHGNRRQDVPLSPDAKNSSRHLLPTSEDQLDYEIESRRE